MLGTVLFYQFLPSQSLLFGVAFSSCHNSRGLAKDVWLFSIFS